MIPLPQILEPPEKDAPLAGSFRAMGSPCEVLMDTRDRRLGDRLMEVAMREALRIEMKFSRYQKESALSRINDRAGQKTEVEEETGRLLDFAHRSFVISDGLFDVTTGVLRKAWLFDGIAISPPEPEVRRLLSLLGWQRVRWEDPFLQMPEGFELDLGGICKEYAADRITQLLLEVEPVSVLVNLGGDVSARGGRDWSVGIEDVNRPGGTATAVLLRHGALATSGDAKRFAIVDGEKRCHILNPRSGRPVENPPRSVTVAAGTCVEAGFFSTLGMLHGAEAEAFLAAQNVQYWCYR